MCSVGQIGEQVFIVEDVARGGRLVLRTRPTWLVRHRPGDGGRMRPTCLRPRSISHDLVTGGVEVTFRGEEELAKSQMTPFLQPYGHAAGALICESRSE